MTSSKIDRVISNADLFEQLSALGTSEEAHKFLQDKNVSIIGDLAEPDQHLYFTVKDAPLGVKWQQLASPQSAAENIPAPSSGPTPPKPSGSHPASPTKIRGLIPDGARINPDVQKALIQFYPESAAWVKVDGIMGPNTRGALNRYKTDYHDERLIDDPEFQEDLIRRGPLAAPMRTVNPSLAALEKKIEQFEKLAVRL